MSEKVILKASELPKFLDMCSYMITVTRKGKFHSAYLFENVSGTFMQDIVPDYRKKFPKEAGYEVTW